MARCLKNEKKGRTVFYGAMIAEGLVALIWAAVAMSFFGGVEELNNCGKTAPVIVNEISYTLLGTVGGILALLGVVFAPITSGDTALRSARLIVSDFLNYNQTKILNRLSVSVPIFIVTFLLTQIDFSIIWRYFAWANQTLATIVLWAITAFLLKEKKFYWITLIPAVFMTAVITTYIFVAPEGLHLNEKIAYPLGIGLAGLSLAGFFYALSLRNKGRLYN